MGAATDLFATIGGALSAQGAGGSRGLQQFMSNLNQRQAQEAQQDFAREAETRQRGSCSNACIFILSQTSEVPECPDGDAVISRAAILGGDSVRVGQPHPGDEFLLSLSTERFVTQQLSAQDRVDKGFDGDIGVKLGHISASNRFEGKPYRLACRLTR